MVIGNGQQGNVLVALGLDCLVKDVLVVDARFVQEGCLLLVYIDCKDPERRFKRVSENRWEEKGQDGLCYSHIYIHAQKMQKKNDILLDDRLSTMELNLGT